MYAGVRILVGALTGPLPAAATACRAGWVHPVVLLALELLVQHPSYVRSACIPSLDP